MKQEGPDELASTALQNVTASAGARLLGLIVGMILTPFVLHRLGRELYGIVVAAGSIFEYLSLLRGGMGAALRRYVTFYHHSGDHDAAKEHYAVGFWSAGLLRSAILVIGIFLAEPLCRFVQIPPSLLHDGTIGVALIIAAAVVADAGTMLDIPIYATGRTSRLAAVRAIRVSVRLLLVILAFSLFVPTMSVYGASLIVVELVPIAILIWWAQRSGVVGPAIPRPRFGTSEIRRRIFQYGGLAIVAQAASLLYLSTDHLLIGRFFGAGAVTEYSLGTRWSPLILSFLVASLGSLVPLFTKMEAKGESQRSRLALSQLVTITAAFAVPFCLAPCVVGDLFLIHWVGAEYRGSAVYMIAMLAPSTLEATLAPVWMSLTARGRIGWVASAQIITAVGNIGLSLFLALGLKLELLGFALGNTTALLAKNLLLYPILKREDFGIPNVSQLLARFPRAIVGAAPGLVLLYVARPIIDGGLAQVIVAGLLGGAICLAGAVLTAIGPAELRMLIQKARGRNRVTGEE